MINKQSLWFLTLFSLILVLSVYYITMPNELLLTNNSSYTKSEQTSSTEKEKEKDVITVTESTLLTSLRVSLEEEREIKITDLQSKLTSKDVSTEEKNNIYEEIKYINKTSATEDSLEKKIKDSKNLDSFVKIDKDKIEVVITSKTHNNTLAVEIMELLQQEFTEKMYISVKFES